MLTLRRHCFWLAPTSLVVFFDKLLSRLTEQRKKKVVREKNVQNILLYKVVKKNSKKNNFNFFQVSWQKILLWINLKFNRNFWRQSLENLCKICFFSQKRKFWTNICFLKKSTREIGKIEFRWARQETDHTKMISLKTIKIVYIFVRKYYYQKK